MKAFVQSTKPGGRMFPDPVGSSHGGGVLEKVTCPGIVDAPEGGTRKVTCGKVPYLRCAKVGFCPSVGCFGAR
jgi:hypothetical protein